MRIGFFIALHEEAADDAGCDAECRDQQREDCTLCLISDHTQSNRRDQRADVGFKKVSAHASHVAYVVAYVIRDSCRVSGIVFGDTGFDLADQVGADVSRFGIDTAAHTGKQCDGGSTERKA